MPPLHWPASASSRAPGRSGSRAALMAMPAAEAWTISPACPRKPKPVTSVAPAAPAAPGGAARGAGPVVLGGGRVRAGAEGLGEEEPVARTEAALDEDAIGMDAPRDAEA